MEAPKPKCPGCVPVYPWSALVKWCEKHRTLTDDEKRAIWKVPIPRGK